jgi:hypothetical protein
MQILITYAIVVFLIDFDMTTIPYTALALFRFEDTDMFISSGSDLDESKGIHIPQDLFVAQ